MITQHSQQLLPEQPLFEQYFTICQGVLIAIGEQFEHFSYTTIHPSSTYQTFITPIQHD